MILPRASTHLYPALAVSKCLKKRLFYFSILHLFYFYVGLVDGLTVVRTSRYFTLAIASCSKLLDVCVVRMKSDRQQSAALILPPARPPARSDGTIVSNRVDSIESISTIRRQIEVVVFDSSIHSPRLAAVGAYYSSCPEDILE